MTPTAVTYASYGYPAGSPFNGAWENTCTSGSCGRDNSVTPPSVSISCDSTGGCSGGPWLVNSNQIGSVNSYGYNNQPNVLYGPFFDATTNSFYLTYRG